MPTVRGVRRAGRREPIPGGSRAPSLARDARPTYTPDGRPGFRGPHCVGSTDVAAFAVRRRQSAVAERGRGGVVSRCEARGRLERLESARNGQSTEVRKGVVCQFEGKHEETC